MRVNVNCPCCDQVVTAVVAPAEKRTRDYPGYPPVLEDVEGCGCFAYLDHLFHKVWISGEKFSYRPALDRYEEQVFEAVDEEMMALEDMRVEAQMQMEDR